MQIIIHYAVQWFFSYLEDQKKSRVDLKMSQKWQKKEFRDHHHRRDHDEDRRLSFETIIMPVVNNIIFLVYEKLPR